MKVPHTKNRHLGNIKPAYTHNLLLNFAIQTTDIKALFYWGHTPYLALPTRQKTKRSALSSQLEIFRQKTTFMPTRTLFSACFAQKVGRQFPKPSMSNPEEEGEAQSDGLLCS